MAKENQDGPKEEAESKFRKVGTPPKKAKVRKKGRKTRHMYEGKDQFRVKI